MFTIRKKSLIRFIRIYFDSFCQFSISENKPGTCRRSLCECDKKLSEDLSEAQWHWQPLYHKNWGGFDNQAFCRSDANDSG